MNIGIKGDKMDNKYEIFIAGNKDTRNIRKKRKKTLYYRMINIKEVVEVK